VNRKTGPLLLCALVVGCDHGGSGHASGDDASASVVTSANTPDEAAAHAPPAATPSHREVQPHPLPPCKAATVEGSVLAVPLATPGPLWGVRPAKAEDGGLSVVATAAVPDDVWIDVGKASRLTTRDAVSTRETTYLGPGRFRVCIAHKEEAWVASGLFESIGGAGERPGGEEWVTTPFGVARYDVARLKLTVKEKSEEVRVSSGTGYLWAAKGVTTQYFSDAGRPPPTLSDEGWVRLDGATGAALTIAKPVMTLEGAGAALDQCAQNAALAKSVAIALAEPDASLAELAPKHMVLRREARAACGVANLRIESLAPSPDREALLERVRAAELDYKTIEPVATSQPDH
jgi:hypothetical protein